MDYEQVKSECEKLETEIRSISLQLEQLPEGKLICNKNGMWYKWYHSDGHHWTYIPKNKRAYAESLAVKTFLEEQKNYLSKKKRAAEQFLKVCPRENRAEQLLAEASGYQELLAPYFEPKTEELLKWAKEKYDRNPNYLEQLSQKVSDGSYVRSKSEAMIDLVLRLNKIPFRYECLLELGGVPYYPDFTIRHPITGKVFYWEHFGLMDEPEYCRKTFSKLQTYASFNIIPTINLITTYETRKEPLNLEMIEREVKYYFC